MKKIDLRALKNLEAQQEHQVFHISENILAVDYGQKYTGIALAQKSGSMVALGVLDTNEQLEKKIREYLEEKKIERIIFGLPLSQDGAENPLCILIKKFAQKLKSKSIEIEFVNEKYSSRMTFASDGGRVDDLAALRILEFYLSTGKVS